MWTAEQKKAASDRMKERHEKNRKKKLKTEQVTVEEIPTIVEAQAMLDEANTETPTAEPQTVDEIDEIVTLPFTGEKYSIPTNTPIRVTYAAINRNFGLTLPDPRRGKKLIDGSVVSDKTINFFEHRYETQSLEERIGIETSQSFLHNRVDILKGIKRLFPDMKREPRNLPTERQFLRIMGIKERTVADDPNMASMTEPWTKNEEVQSGA